MAIAAPLELYTDRVRSEWIDHNGHMNMGYYLVVFDFATDAFLDFCGLTTAHRQQQRITTFALEAHVNYLGEVREGDPLKFRTHLIAYDAKRIHYIHEMIHAEEGYRAATNELMSLHVSLETRRGASMADEVMAQLARIEAAHRGVPAPPEVGRRISLERKP